MKKGIIFFLIVFLIVMLVGFALVWAQSSRVKKGGTLPKSTMKASAQLPQLPPQPKSNRPALPDITIKEFKFSGPSGPWVPGKTYNIGVVLENVGQYETGDFYLKLNVRVQVPSIRKDEISTISEKRVSSIQPRKTGVPGGTSKVWFNYTTGNYNWAQYTFTAVADSTNHIEEFDEANNEKTSLDQTVDTYR